MNFVKRIDRKVLYIHRSVQRNLDLKGEKPKDKAKILNENKLVNKSRGETITKTKVLY